MDTSYFPWWKPVDLVETLDQHRNDDNDDQLLICVTQLYSWIKRLVVVLTQRKNITIK